jgi:putative membrane protein
VTDLLAKPAPMEPLAALEAGENTAAVSTELAARRTGLSFQRTRLSADRTLMSVIRTSLSLISFGFTIFQFFQKLKGSQILAGESHAPRNFGATLVWLGVGMLIIGIVYHLQFMWGLRGLRDEMRAQGIVHAHSGFPVSFTLLVAIALLFIGLAAIASMTFHIGPF